MPEAIEAIELLDSSGSVTQTLMLSTNQVGSVQLVTDAATGAVVQRIAYDEFGRILSDSAPDSQPFGFAGGLYDAETKLVRFGARDYASDVGRWIARDPVRLRVGSNAWLYGENDPIQYQDPSGYVSLPSGPRGDCEWVADTNKQRCSSSCWFWDDVCQNICAYEETLEKLRCKKLPEEEEPRKDDEEYGPCDWSNECVACL